MPIKYYDNDLHAWDNYEEDFASNTVGMININGKWKLAFKPLPEPTLFYARLYDMGNDEVYMFFETCSVQDHLGGGTFISGIEFVGGTGSSNDFLNLNPQISPPWFTNSSVNRYAEKVKKIIFTKRFCKYAKPKNLYNFFEIFRRVRQFINLDKLNTSRVTDIRGCLQDLYDIEELDISGWDTAAMYYTYHGFDGNTNLKTIYAKDIPMFQNVRMGSQMFSRCNKLVGGNGTTLSDGDASVTYARVDKPGVPGYFTLKEG